MERELNFTEDDWERVERDTEAWWAGELERPLVYLTGMPADAPKPPYEYLTNYPASMPAEEVADRCAARLAATRYYGDAFPLAWVNCGPGIAAGFLGAYVNSVIEPSETVWFTPRGGQAEALPGLRLAYTSNNTWWQRVRDLTAAFVARYDSTLQVGCTDLGGSLDILASFRTTQQLLVDLIEQPDEVLRLSSEITTAWLQYYDELDAIIRPTCRGTSCWTPLWAPGKTYMLQSDFAYMISPRMFERFVMPDLETCCSHLDYGFYHLDGKGEIAHLPLLMSISRLRGVQWIPGDGQPPPDQWPALLKRIRDGGKLCQVFVSAKGALNIARNLGGKGFLFVIQGEEREFADPEVADAFLKALLSL